MFVRFRQTQTTLQASLIEGRRRDGRVLHEQVATFGAVKLPLTIAGREDFWRTLHQHLTRLGNRLDGAAQAKVMAAVHARIPMVTREERHARDLENAEQDQRVWNGWHDLLAERSDGNSRLAERAVLESKNDQALAEDAGVRAAATAERIERLRRGEDVPPEKPVDLEAFLRETGWTTADIEHARVAAALGEDSIPILVKVHLEAGERAARAAARRMLRSLTAKSP